jgi:hypothetical protein
LVPAKHLDVSASTTHKETNMALPAIRTAAPEDNNVTLISQVYINWLTPLHVGPSSQLPSVRHTCPLEHCPNKRCTPSCLVVLNPAVTYVSKVLNDLWVVTFTPLKRSDVSLCQLVCSVHGYPILDMSVLMSARISDSILLVSSRDCREISKSSLRWFQSRLISLVFSTDRPSKRISQTKKPMKPMTMGQYCKTVSAIA